MIEEKHIPIIKAEENMKCVKCVVKRYNEIQYMILHRNLASLNYQAFIRFNDISILPKY